MHRLRFVALALTLAACGDVESPGIVAVVPVGSFEGRVENGELVSLRMLSAVEAAAHDARIEQGLEVIPEDRNGRLGTSAIVDAVELTTESAAGGFANAGVVVDGCGAGNNAMVVNAGVRNFHTVDLANTFIEIMSFSGDTDDHSLCNSDSASPNTLVNDTTPLNNALGLVRYGHLVKDENGFATAPGLQSTPAGRARPIGVDSTARARPWRFRNGGGTFNFRGRVLASPCDVDCTPGNAVNEGPLAAPNAPRMLDTNGSVLAVAEGDGVVYLGGNFTRVGPRTGSAMFATLNSAQLGTALATHPAFEGGTVDAIVGDGNGGFYVGGSFTSVGGQAKARLVRVLSSGLVDPAFVPPTTVTNNAGVVQALALDTTSGRLWVGRSTLPFLSVLTAASGAPAFASPTVPTQPNEGVRAIAITDNAVFIGGRFTNYTGVGARDKLARLDSTTGLVVDVNFTTPPPANANPGLGDGAAVDVSCITTDGATVWVGGNFTTPRARAAAWLVTGGNVLPWNPNIANGEVRAIAQANGVVYLGGTFTSVRGQTRNRLAAVEATATANANSMRRDWNPNPNGTIVNSVQISDSDVYVGGDFTTISSQPRDRAAVLDAVATNTTPPVRAFNPAPGGGTTPDVRAIALAGARVGIGGTFALGGSTSRSRLAAIDLETGTLMGSDANISNGEVRTIAPDGGRIYVGGTFTTVSGQTRERVAALDASSFALITSFTADANSDVDAIDVGDDGIYLAGNFTDLNGSFRGRLARVSPAGAVDNWGVGGLVAANGRVRTIHETSNGVVVGGDFDSLRLGFSNELRLAVLNRTNGNIVARLDTNASVHALAVVSGGRAVVVGGAFTTVAGQTRNRLAALDVATNALTTFAPTGFNGAVLSIDSRGHAVAVGGTFTAPRPLAATIDIDATNIVLPFSPMTGTGTVNAVRYIDGGVAIGGAFTATVKTAGGVDVTRTSLALVNGE